MTRRRYFGDSQETLVTERKNHPELDQRWCELRKDKVTRENKLATEVRVSGKLFVDKLRGVFNDCFEEAGFTSLGTSAQRAD